MRFSIIIPIYKVEQYLNQCVQSILSQSYSDFEVILVDDGSPDNCPAMCDHFSLDDERVRVIHKTNGGLSSARNAGFNLSTGDYVIFLDSDDWWSDPEALDKFNRRIIATDADVVVFRSRKYFDGNQTFSHVEKVDENLSRYSFLDIETLMRNTLFVASAWDKVIRRSVLEENNILFVDGQLSEDVEWCCKLLTHKLNYSFEDSIVHVYRQGNPNAITRNITNKNLSDVTHVMDYYHNKAIIDRNEPILHFLAPMYIVWCANSFHATGSYGRELISSMKSHFSLLNYTWYPRVRTVARFKFLGYNVLRLLLVAYLKWR